MKVFYAISQDVLDCDPACVTHHLLAGCFNNSGARYRCRIKRDVEALKFRRQCKHCNNSCSGK